MELNLPDDVMAGLQRAASMSGRSMTHEIIRRLRESLRDRPNLHDRLALAETRIIERLDDSSLDYATATLARPNRMVAG